MVRLRRLADLSTGAFAFSLIGLLHALWIADLSGTAGVGSMRTLLAIVAIYGAVGVFAGLIALAIRSTETLARRVLAVSPGLFMVAMSWAQHGWSQRMVAYAGLGVVLYRVIIGLFRRAPELAGVTAWQRLHACVFAWAFVAGLSHDPTSIRIAIAALVPALICTIGSFKLELLASVASLPLLIAASWLAFWHPPDRPDVDRVPTGPSVLLVTLDTLRADHVGAYGHRDAKTPVMDALAADGVLFGNAITHSPYTGPSHLSMLTGRLPTNIDVLVNEVALPRSQRLLADWLRREGYLTAGFVSGWPLIDDVIEIADRFHTYEDDLREFTFFPARASEIGLLHALDRVWVQRQFHSTVPDRRAELTANGAVAWLERNAGSRFFAWVHFYDPHLPYEPQERYLDRKTRAYTGPATGAWYGLDAGTKGSIIRDPASMKHMAELYDAEIAHADEMLGRVVRAARGAAKDGLFILVTADHGEAFGENRLFFARDLYEPTLRVPLIVVPAHPTAIKRVDAQVKLSDVAPTILDAVGIQPYDPLDGQSLLPLVHGSTLSDTGPAFAFKIAESREYIQQSYAVRYGGLKLIQREEGWNDQDRWNPATSELYDLALDPTESIDVVGARVDDRRRLERLLVPELPQGGLLRLDLSPEELEALRSLGYMD